MWTTGTASGGTEEGLGGTPAQVCNGDWNSQSCILLLFLILNNAPITHVEFLDRASEKKFPNTSFRLSTSFCSFPTLVSVSLLLVKCQHQRNRQTIDILPTVHPRTFANKKRIETHQSLFTVFTANNITAY